MFKKLKTTWWGVSILLIINLYIVDLFSEYIINREVMKEVQIVLTLGVLVSSVYVIKLLVNYVYNNLKEKKDD
jgi:Na+/H+ antiporter NhaB